MLRVCGGRKGDRVVWMGEGWGGGWGLHLHEEKKVKLPLVNSIFSF